MLVCGLGVGVCVYIVGTCGSGVLSSAGDVVEMTVVRDVGGVCDMGMCLVGGVRGLDLGFTNPGESGVYVLVAVVWVGGLGGRLDPWSCSVVLCLCML